MPNLSIKGISKKYGNNVIIDDFNLEINDGEMIALLGPSGCGKTTLLRTIAGFTSPSSGSIYIGEQDITDLPPHLRRVSMVFQRYALFPHMTIEQNVSFGLKMHRCAPDKIERKVLDALKLVDMLAYRERLPGQLSGGQQQRVAIARAIVVDPQILLLDEPLSNLDAKLRHSVGLELRSLQRRIGVTTVFVTHDQNEALMLADRLAILNGGKLMQLGRGQDLYENPESYFVADFMGRCNLLRGTFETKSIFITSGGSKVVVDTLEASKRKHAVLALRPEVIKLGRDSEAHDNSFLCRVIHANYFGATTEYQVALESGETLIVTQPNDFGSAQNFRIGDEAFVGWTASNINILEDPMD